MRVLENAFDTSIFNCSISQLAVYPKSFLKKAEQDSCFTKGMFI